MHCWHLTKSEFLADHSFLRQHIMEIRKDNLSGPEITLLLQSHIEELYAISRPESMHALNLNALHDPSITFYSVWADTELMGCGSS